MAITFPKELEKRLSASLQRYFRENLEITLGELPASLLLQFCLEEIGPAIYNRAISDGQSYLQEKVLDMENSCYSPESTYWLEHERRVERGKKAEKERTAKKWP